MPKLELLGEVRGSRLSAALVRCDGHDGAAREENTDDARVWFVMRGRFELASARARRAADPASALLLQPGESFCVRHPEGCGDVCLSLGGPVVEALADAPRPTAPVATSSFLAIHALARRMGRGETPEPIEFEEAVCEAVAGDSAPADSPTRFEVRLADSIAHELAMRFDERLSLADLAAPRGVSVFAVCRAYRSARGTSVHRALQRLRVRHALALMLDTSWSLARIAAECGFASHAHLTGLFRRELGSSPGRLRRERLSA
jgi:AraC-like DNA-binding protein